MSVNFQPGVGGGRFKSQDPDVAFGALYGRFQTPGEKKFLALSELLGFVDQALPPAIGKGPEEHRLNLAPVGREAEDTGFSDPGVIEDHQSARGNQGRQVGHVPMVPGARCGVDDQQPAQPPGLGGRLGDEFIGQMKEELPGFQNSPPWSSSRLSFQSDSRPRCW